MGRSEDRGERKDTPPGSRVKFLFSLSGGTVGSCPDSPPTPHLHYCGFAGPVEPPAPRGTGLKVDSKFTIEQQGQLGLKLLPEQALTLPGVGCAGLGAMSRERERDRSKSPVAEALSLGSWLL